MRTIAILLLAFTLASCTKEEGAEYTALPVKGEVPQSIEEVKSAIIGTWTYEGEDGHYVSFGADGIRCIGYSPDALDQCMRYEINEVDGEFVLCVYAIGNLEGTGNRYCMTASITDLTDYTLQYQSTVHRSLRRLP